MKSLSRFAAGLLAALIFSPVAHAIELSVTGVAPDPQTGASQVQLAWQPAYSSLPGGRAGGITFPPMDVSPERVYLLQWTPGANRPDAILLSGNPLQTTALANLNGVWKYQIQYEGSHPMTGRFWRDWSNIVEVAVAVVPATPALNPPDPANPQAGQNFTLSWSGPGAAIYQLEESLDSSFTNVSAQFWPSNPWEVVPGRPAGTRYYRVRGWSSAPENGGIAGAWSSTLTVAVSAVIPAAPTLTGPAGEQLINTAYSVTWTASAGTVVYQLQASRTADFAQVTGEYWPSGTSEPIVPTVVGDHYYRVRAWNGLPEQGAQSSSWSASLLVKVTAGPVPAAPQLFNPTPPPIQHGFTLRWTGVANAAVYQVQESTTSNFRTISKEYWPSAPWDVIRNAPSSTAYYRVRGWNALPENGGAAGKWSKALAVSFMSDSALLDYVSRATFDYFIASTLPNGLTLDRVSTVGQDYPIASSAASGFYLSSLTVGASRGWISAADGYNRALATLQTFDTAVARQNGFFYHFLNPDGSPSEVPFLEISSIDTALFIAGALQAGEYFGGEVKTLADKLYREVDWRWMYDPNSGFMKQAWTPWSGGPSGDYGGYSEAILLYLLAIGSPSHPVPGDAFYAFTRPKGNYAGPDFVFTGGGQLFIYQYPQIWFDFRNTADAMGVNWWNNSVEGVRANQRYCKDNPWMGYSENVWGLTASDGPYRTPENTVGYKAYGAKPSYYNESDGTVAPTGSVGSIALDPALGMAALKELYGVHGEKIWTAHGFVDSFNLNLDWADDWFISIDQGTILLMIENHRSELIWDTFMQNEHVINALARAGFSGFAPAQDRVVDDFEDGNLYNGDTALVWWTASPGVYQYTDTTAAANSGTHAMRLDYNKGADAWAFVGAGMQAGNPNRDIAAYDRIGVHVYGSGEILLKLRDGNDQERDIATLQSSAPDGWNHLVFDFSGSDLNLADIKDLLFFVAPGQTGVSGTVHVDDVRLEIARPIKLEDFEDGQLWSPESTLGWWDIDGTVVYRHWTTMDPSLGGLRAMQTDYTKAGYDWSHFGGFIASENPNKDFSRRTRLSFWVHGGGTLLVKLRDRAMNEAELGTVNFNSWGWRKVSFDYSRAQGINLQDIENVLFFADPGNGGSSGNFAIDDIVLE